MEDFIYWRHPTIPGIKVEEITGGERYTGKIWYEMARQLYCENGRDDYRDIGHFRNGAPFLHGESTRISITHCNGLLAVATLAPTADTDLSAFNEISCLGIDSERTDREQVLRIREKFLSEEELNFIKPDDLIKNIQAWTAKEAILKAGMKANIDFKYDIKILRLPKIGPAVPVFDPKEYGLDKNQKDLPEEFFGEAKIVIREPDNESDGNYGDKEANLILYSYITEKYLVTLAYSPRSATFGN